MPPQQIFFSVPLLPVKPVRRKRHGGLRDFPGTPPVPRKFSGTSLFCGSICVSREEEPPEESIAPPRLRPRSRRLHRFASLANPPGPGGPRLRNRQLRSLLRPADQGAEPGKAFGAPVVLLPRGGYPRRVRPRPMGGGDARRRADPPGREGGSAPVGRRSRRVRGRERPRYDPGPRLGAGTAGPEAPVRLLLVRLRREYEGPLRRGRLRRSPGEPLRGDEEGGGAPLPHLLPPLRDERGRPALLHRLRSEAAP